MKASENNDILDSFEAAKLLKVGRAALLRECRAGNVPCTRIGAQWRFSRSALHEWLHTKPEPGRKEKPAQPEEPAEPKPARKPRAPKQGQLV